MFQAEGEDGSEGYDSEDEDQLVCTRTKRTDVYALGMVCIFPKFVYTFVDLVTLDHAGKSMYTYQLSMLFEPRQEIFTGAIPYSEYRNDVGVYRAIDRKQPPRQPQVLTGPDPRATPMWNILLKCWDHDPSVRPDAPSVLAWVC